MDNDEREKLQASAEALCRAVGYDYTETPEVGKMTLLRATTSEDSGDGLAIFPIYTLAKITKLDSHGNPLEYATPFGLIDITAQEMAERIEVATNALYLREHPEER